MRRIRIHYQYCVLTARDTVRTQVIWMNIELARRFVASSYLETALFCVQLNTTANLLRHG
jgi:hypothetical protein